MSNFVKSLLRLRPFNLRSFKTLPALLLTSLILHGQILAQKGRGDEPLSDELYELVTKRTKAIQEEISSGTAGEWAGTYFDGDHHATVLTWEPKNGFVVTASHHTFAPTWVNYGNVKFEAGRLRLFPELQKGRPNAYGIEPEFFPVRWDKWHFLVPSDRLLQFAYAVHSNSESRLGSYFAKSGDSDESRKGLPDLPSGYITCMKMPAIRARIVAVNGDPGEVWNSEVVLNVGTRQKVIEGMEFYFLGRSGLNVGLWVTKVGDSRSYARLHTTGSSGDDNSKEVALKVGRIFSSKMPKGFIEPG